MKVCKYYLTYRCNSTCSYCNIWCIKDKTTLSLEQTKKRLDELKQLGVRYVDFTGGEPMLHRNFIEILKYAKKLGMKVEFTTNGFAFDKYLDKAIKYIDYPNISLDTLNREKYKRIRGIDGLERAKNIAKKLGKLSKNAKIICVVTEENIDEIADLLKFAQENHIQIYFSPLFSYFEGMKNSCKYDTVSLDKLFFEPYTMIALHFIEFFNSIDANKYPRCMCNDDVITVSPNGKIISPCYYYQISEIGKKYDSLIDIVNSEEFQKHKRQAGTFKSCKGCTAIPYLGFSFEYKLDYMILLNQFSDNYKKIKVDFLNEASNLIKLDIDLLNKEYSVFKALISTLKATDDNRYLLYSGKKQEDGLIKSPIFKLPISPIKYLYDNLSSNVWSLNNLPFNFVEVITDKILIKLREKAINGNDFNKKYYYELLEKLPLFYISWWIFYLYKIYNVDNSSIDISKYEKIINDYLMLLNKRVLKFDNISSETKYCIEKFKIMCNDMVPYAILNKPVKVSNKVLSDSAINNIIEKLKKDKLYILRFIESINLYSIDSINLVISGIKDNFSNEEINQIKSYIDVYRYKDNYFI